MTTDAEIVGFLVALLKGLSFPSDNAHLVGPLAWAWAEGGWEHNEATYNPLNTTQQAPGSHSINSVGVQAYATEAQGVLATMTTLENGRYPTILAAMENGDPGALADGLASEPWGTSADTMRSLIPRARAFLGQAAPTPVPPQHKEEHVGIAISSDGRGVAAVRSDGHLVVFTTGGSGTFSDANVYDLTDRAESVNSAGGPWTFPTN